MPSGGCELSWGCPSEPLHVVSPYYSTAAGSKKAHPKSGYSKGPAYVAFYDLAFS